MTLFEELQWRGLVSETSGNVDELLENEKVKELKDALTLGIYDIVFDPFDLEDICKKIRIPSSFSDISEYMKDILGLETS